MTTEKKALPKKEASALTALLKERFHKNMPRHKSVKWDDVEARLNKSSSALWSLQAMEETGGEPDVVGEPDESGAVTFYDCAPETPAGRRNVCYDAEALEARKEHKPLHSAVAMAKQMGIEMLDETHYRLLQEYGPFDRKTSSWIITPPAIRKLGGALFGDHRYGTVFIYHNGAQSYYAVRGFRAKLKV